MTAVSDSVSRASGATSGTSGSARASRKRDLKQLQKWDDTFDKDRGHKIDPDFSTCFSHEYPVLAQGTSFPTVEDLNSFVDKLN